MDFDTEVKLAVYRYFAETGHRPSPQDVAELAGSDVQSVLDAYPRLRAQRVLTPEACFDLASFLKDAAQYVSDEHRGKPLLEERLEWLE